MKHRIFNDEEYAELLQHLNQLVDDADSLPYQEAKSLIFEILKYFDSLHREPLSRIMNEIKSNDSELSKRLSEDFTIRTMLGLYDLTDVQTEIAQVDDRVQGFVPADSVGLLSPIEHKEWVEIGHADEFETGQLYPRNFERLNFLVSKIAQNEMYAIQNVCQDSLLPIDLGTLEGQFIICPWHGCKYDLLTGRAVNKEDKVLPTYPVEIDKDQMVKVELRYT